MLTQSFDPCKPVPPARQALLAEALESVGNAIFITDASGHIQWTNHAFTRLCGYSLEELYGNTPAMFNSGMQSKAFFTQLWETILAGHVWRGIVIDRHKDGTLYTVDETITPLLDDTGVIRHFIAIQQDIAPRNRQQEQEHYLAFHDMLTTLPNRAYLEIMLRQALHDAMRDHELVALMFLDLDKFKPVNDRYGHQTGDLLLQAVAERLRSAVRKSDIVSRFGGDEFAILVTGLACEEVALALANKLVHVLSQPFVVDEHKLQIGVSIGIAIFPNDGETEEELYRKADEAMYESKRGGGGFRFCAAGPAPH